MTSFSNSIQVQLGYLDYVHHKALEQIKRLAENDLAFDPQGRILVEVVLTDIDYQAILDKICENDPLFDGHQLNRSMSPITVSLDIKNEALADTFSKKLSGELEKLVNKETCQAILHALNDTPKGSIIALQQEFHFHLQMALRVYLKSSQALQLKQDQLQDIHRVTMRRVNDLVMEQYAEALINAYKKGSEAPFIIDLNTLNKRLDEARKKIMPLAHQILHEEIKIQTGIDLTKNTFNIPLKKWIKKTTATPNDLLHTDNESGLITWIEGSEVTAHDRGLGGEHLATRQMVTHYLHEGVVTAHVNPRVQIRVPSLDIKVLVTEKEGIKDVADKLTAIQDNYLLDKASLNPHPAFIYNLYTSLYHTIDDIGGKNKQTQGANYILQGTHQYNAKALVNPPPLLCFVQNIPINGFGESLGYEWYKKPLVRDATLMSDLALMHTLYRSASAAQQQLIDEIINHYKIFLTDPNRPSYFSQHSAGKEAIQKINQIKTVWQKSVAINQDDIVNNATVCLKQLVAHNLHHKKSFAMLTQSLAVFLEKNAIGGCKSANERAQSINGRVAILDACSFKNEGILSKENQALKAVLQDFARNEGGAASAQAKILKKTLDKAYNSAGLQTAPTLISLVDQGAPAKAQVRGIGFKPNEFEEKTLVNLHQNKASKMQAHKGMGKKMAEVCDEKNIKDNTIIVLPENALPDNPIDTELENKLVEQIGQYPIKEGVDSNEQVVNEQLGNENDASFVAKKKLYKGIDKYQKKQDKKIANYCAIHGIVFPADGRARSQFFRERFIHYVLSKDLKQCMATPVTKQDSPEKATASLNEIFGKEGEKLYQLALKEERYSQEYMDAVFSRSITHYAGERWAERPVIIVAGPSASGKSYATKAAVKMAQDFLAKSNAVEGNATSGNDMVAIDGGIAREVSQMRKWAIRVANQQGFTGISDLHEKSSVLGKAKGCVQNAAFATPLLGVVIPETFSNPLKVQSLMTKIDQLDNTKSIFTRVDGEDPKIFKQVVGFMGSRRAWKTKDFDATGALSLNSTEDLCESKAYDKRGFNFGKLGSIEAEKWYKNHNKNGLSLIITNELLLKKPEGEAWVDAKKGDKGAILVGRRTFDAWLLDTQALPLKAFMAGYNPPSLITTAGEEALVTALEKLEFRIDAIRKKIEKPPFNDSEETKTKRQDKLNRLISVLDTLESLNSENTTAVLNTRDDMKAILNAEPLNKALHKTQAVLSRIVHALDWRLNELNMRDEAQSGANANDERLEGEPISPIMIHDKQSWHDEKHRQEGELKTLNASLVSLDLMKNALKALSNNTFAWLNPAFQASAKKYANRLNKQVKQVAVVCDNTVDDLINKKEKIQLFLDELPGEATLRGKDYESDVHQHRKRLNSQRDQIQSELQNHLLPLQKILNGDAINDNPIARQGLLNTITQAVEEKKGIQLFSFFNSDYVDFTSDKKNRLLTQPFTGKSEANASLHMESGKTAPVYKMIERVAKGFVREYTISNTHEEIGRFIEEPASLKSEENAGESIISPKLSVSHFPIGDAKTDKKARDNKIIYAFAMATQLLASLESAPTCEKAIIIRGTNKEAIQYLWTALMVIGQQSPHMKFGAEAIKVKSTDFNLSQEKGWMTRFSNQSCYHDFFAHSDVLKAIINDIKELSINKLGHQKDQLKLETDLSHISKAIKDNSGAEAGINNGLNPKAII